MNSGVDQRARALFWRCYLGFLLMVIGGCSWWALH